MMGMTTLKEQVLDALKITGEKKEDLVCFYQVVVEGQKYAWDRESLPNPIQCTFDDLPERKYDAGYGIVEGEPFIGFSEKYVYISVQYHGSEEIEAIPRHPRYVGKTIPVPGG